MVPGLPGKLNSVKLSQHQRQSVGVIWGKCSYLKVLPETCPSSCRWHYHRYHYDYMWTAGLHVVTYISHNFVKWTCKVHTSGSFIEKIKLKVRRYLENQAISFSRWWTIVIIGFHFNPFLTWAFLDHQSWGGGGIRAPIITLLLLLRWSWNLAKVSNLMYSIQW